MKITLRALGSTRITVKDSNGIENDDVAEIVLEPSFMSPRERTELLSVLASDNKGRQRDKYVLCVSGATGKVARRDDTRQAVKAAVDAEEENAKQS